jgi:thiamine-phosphate pyrophosphorylase
MTHKPKICGLQFIISTHIIPFCSFLELAIFAIQGGVDGIQFRHKGNYTREQLELTQQLSILCQKATIPFIVNDRADIAKAVDAAGVHLGQTDLPIASARKILGEKKIIGKTSSNLEQAQQAVNEGADYVSFGHIFPTKNKFKSSLPVGLRGLNEACQKIKIPILAVGGIAKENLAAVCQTGVNGVAVISAIATSPNPRLQTQKLKNIMNAQGSF